MCPDPPAGPATFLCLVSVFGVLDRLCEGVGEGVRSIRLDGDVAHPRPDSAARTKKARSGLRERKSLFSGRSEWRDEGLKQQKPSSQTSLATDRLAVASLL